MAQFERLERRHKAGTLEEQFQQDVGGLAQRVLREGVPINKTELREMGEKREKLVAAVQEKVARLFGLQRAEELSVEKAELVPLGAITIKGNGAELSYEQVELLRNMEEQYGLMVSALDRYEISKEGMPGWDEIKGCLTPEVIAKALKLEVPTLIMLPPTTRQAKVDVLDQHKVEGQSKTVTYEFSDNNLWNAGKSDMENKWHVDIVEGVEDVPADPDISGTNYEMTKQWVEKYEKQGLDVVEGADPYLMLQMRAFPSGKKIDSQTFTVLNPKNVTEKSPVAGGHRDNSKVRVILATDNSANSNKCLRVRASVRVM